MLMRTRQEIKAIAKEAMKAQRGTAILLLVVYTALTLVGSLISAIPILGAIASIAYLIAIVVISVGLNGGYVKIYRGIAATVNDLFSGFNDTFMRKCGGMLWVELWVCLWSMLFLIPGIIKMYSYMLTPYILGEYPNVKATDAIKLSMRMTDGHKGELFMMQLSFFGWTLLSTLTFHILGVLYVFPYMNTAMAGCYTELRDLALTTGVVRPEELM